MDTDTRAVGTCPGGCKWQGEGVEGGRLGDQSGKKET